MPLFGQKPSKKPTRIYYATDLHGSQRTFRKFINAGKFYGADFLIMGGDILGKLAIPIICEANGHYRATLQGRTYVFVVTSLAGALLPYRAKELYEASPGAHYKVGNIPLITILGGVGAVVGTLMVATFEFSKELGVLGNWDFTDFPNHVWAQIIAIAIIAVSAVWYFVAKSGQKSRGINVEYAFKEIPPE
jgi:hypothetical protein